MRKYHLVTDDEERDITADTVTVEPNGALTFRHQAGEIIVSYAPGQWRYVEVEARDDRA